jgi:hypothetical protein
MDHNDLKLFFLNSTTLAVSFSALEDTLKLVLLILSIVYTVQRMNNLYNKKKED